MQKDIWTLQKDAQLYFCNLLLIFETYNFWTFLSETLEPSLYGIFWLCLWLSTPAGHKPALEVEEIKRILLMSDSAPDVAKILGRTRLSLCAVLPWWHYVSLGWHWGVTNTVTHGTDTFSKPLVMVLFEEHFGTWPLSCKNYSDSNHCLSKTNPFPVLLLKGVHNWK